MSYVIKLVLESVLSFGSGLRIVEPFRFYLCSSVRVGTLKGAEIELAKYLTHRL